MSNNALATRAIFKTSSPPKLSESQRRLLADGFHLGDTVPKWEPPAVLPDSSKLRSVKIELERGLESPNANHVQWCLNKLFSRPTRDPTEEKAAFQAETFLDACGHFPDDLWTLATTELLQTQTFRAAPAEMYAIANPRYRERQRMLERVNLMLAGGAPKPAAPFVPEPEDVRLRTLRDSLKRVGRLDRAAGYEMRLASLEARQPEEWAVNPPAPQPIAERFDLPKLPPPSAETRARTMVAAAAFHRKQGHKGIADMHLADARKLCPEIFEETQS